MLCAQIAVFATDGSTLAVAVYAAVVASAALGWQIISTLREARTRLTVNAVPFIGGETPAVFWLEITNISRHDVTCDRLRFDWSSSDGEGRALINDLVEFDQASVITGDFPCRIPARSSENLKVRLDHDATLLRAAVRTADGRWFSSVSLSPAVLDGPRGAG